MNVFRTLYIEGSIAFNNKIGEIFENSGMTWINNNIETVSLIEIFRNPNVELVSNIHDLRKI